MCYKSVIVLLLLFPVSLFCQDFRWLQGTWEGILDQGIHAEADAGYKAYYTNGAFAKGKPTHVLQLDITTINGLMIRGVETKTLIADSQDHASFTFEGLFDVPRNAMVYHGVEKVSQHLTRSLNYCLTADTYLTHNSDDDYDYLQGTWKGTHPSGYCVDAKIFLRKAKTLHSTPALKEPALLINRIVKDSMTTTSPQLSLEVYDNAEEDGDTVTIMHNGKVIAEKIRLQTKPTTIDLSLTEGVNYIDMVALNLGTIPPNTAFLKFRSGQTLHSIVLHSTQTQTGSIKIIYTKTE